MVVTIVDPQNPVVINVSVTTLPAPTDLIRKFMKVSSGDTNLGNGNFQAVTSSNWQTVFDTGKETSESYLWMAAFFAQAPDATVYILEATEVADLTAFIDSAIDPMYLYSVPASWYDANSYAPAFLTGGSGATGVFGTWTPVTDGSFNISIDGDAITVSALDFSSALDMDDVAAVIQAGIRAETGALETCVWDTDHFLVSSVLATAASAITVTSAAGLGTDISGAGATPFMDSDSGQGTVTDTVETPASNPFITLVQAHISVTAALYFAIEITHGISPAQDSNFTAYAAPKSLFPIYGNDEATQSVPGTMIGIMASTIYDLSATNKATMFNYKKTNGLTVEIIDATFRIDLNDAGVNYIGALAGEAMVFNGRYADLTTWEYWYEWDWFQITLENRFTAAIVNGSNVPAAAIQYNQNGIDALTAVANGTANTGKLYGAVTEFAKSFNIVTDELEGVGTFAAVPFYEYIAAAPADYAAGIYQGLSAYVLLGRFIRKVVIAVTIN